MGQKLKSVLECAIVLHVCSLKTSVIKQVTEQICGLVRALQRATMRRKCQQVNIHHSADTTVSSQKDRQGSSLTEQSLD